MQRSTLFCWVLEPDSISDFFTFQNYGIYIENTPKQVSM